MYNFTSLERVLLRRSAEGSASLLQPYSRFSPAGLALFTSLILVVLPSLSEDLPSLPPPTHHTYSSLLSDSRIAELT